MKSSIPFTVVLLLALAYGLGNAAGGASGSVTTAKQLVYSVCNESRISATINETQCGDMQDETNTEFLCEANNTSPINYCWVEVK